MSEQDLDRQAKQIALFRYGVIVELLRMPAGSPQLRAALTECSEREHQIPGSHRTRVSVSTLREWMRSYRQGGFDALCPKRRADRGRSRRLSTNMIEALLATKRNAMHLSVDDVIARVRKEQPDDRVELPRSTVHRLLSREGLMRPADNTVTQDRRRFAYEHAGELWMSDVMYGPTVRDDSQRLRRTYLIAFIDDATRVVPYAAFAFSENLVNFQQVFKQALMRRGLPDRLYVDNGASYRSQQLALVCARLDIVLIHARPYTPAGKGKIERFFRTCRMRFLEQLPDTARTSIGELNSRFRAWLEGEYHRTPHRGLDGLTPLDKWAQAGSKVRLVDAATDLEQMFLFEAMRRVRNDRTVQLNNHLYEVDAQLIGQRVTLRYDPTAQPQAPLLVYRDQTAAGEAQPLNLHANARVRRQRPPIELRKLANRREQR